MVKLTIVARVSDGLPLAQGPRYMNEENENFFLYKQQAEFILREISRGALAPSKMVIRVDHHCFNYMIEKGYCYITLSESSYPRKLAFHYLQDLQREFEKTNSELLEKITRPYSFIGFDSVIAKIRKQYLDTRTQANLSKLNAGHRYDTDVVTEQMSKLIENGRKLELLEKAMLAPRPVSSIWCSPCLEVIALKWTPITILLFVAMVLFWTVLILTDWFISTTP